MDYYTAMKIAYDMSVLGVGHVLPISRTGTHRVTWALAQALAQNEAVDFQSCWAHGVDPLMTHDDPVLNQACAWDTHRLRLGTSLLGAVNSACYRCFPPTLNAMRLPLLLARWDAECHSSLTQSNWNGIQILHSMAYPVPRHRRIKTVLTLHDVFPLTNPEWFEPQARWHFKQLLHNAEQSDAILCPSQATKQALLTHTRLRPDQIWVVPWGVSEPFITHADLSSNILQVLGLRSQHYVLMVGTLEPRKNLQHSVDAYLLWRREHPGMGIPLVLVGPKGWCMNNNWLSKRLKPGEESWIKLTGFCDDVTLSTLYHHATGLFYTSLAEGFGLPILEAMACGCPVITSNTSSMPEVAGDHAMLVDPGDITVMAEALATLIHQYPPESSERIAHQQILQAYAHSHTWSHVAQSLIAMYQTLLR